MRGICINNEYDCGKLEIGKVYTLVDASEWNKLYSYDKYKYYYTPTIVNYESYPWYDTRFKIIKDDINNVKLI
jgi:hypothetical protein